MIALFGAIGNIFFGIKSVFQVKQCYKSKSTDGLSTFMLIADFIGNICCATYIYGSTGFTLWWQFVNYGLATLFLLILFGMKIKYKKCYSVLKPMTENEINEIYKNVINKIEKENTRNDIENECIFTTFDIRH